MVTVRRIQAELNDYLRRYPAVALLGPRQVGKTTLAHAIAADAARPTVYLDLERDSDRSKLDDAESYFGRHSNALVILDEVQRRPELFTLMRSVIDERIRKGLPAGHFLVLGSASRDLLQQSSESLAGRLATLELSPFDLREVQQFELNVSIDRLWLRGGFPLSYLASQERASFDWRGQFVGTYLERDIPQLGPKLPAEQLRRFWRMLANGQGDLLNSARLAAALGLSGNTVRRYLDLLTDLYMVRQLFPWAGNMNKRVVKSPKVYVRDSGLLHVLANIPDMETLLGHPLCGRSFEGFAIEQIVCGLSNHWKAWFYRTSAGAEVDLILEGPKPRTIAIEIKRSTSPTISKGFHLGSADVGATEKYVVMPSGEAHSLGQGVEALSLSELLSRLFVDERTKLK